MRDPWAFQRWAFDVQTGNPVRKSVLSMLSMMADGETGRCEAKQATIAAGTEISERAVRGHLKALEAEGIIARRAQFRRDRGRRGDEFLLLAPWVTEWPDGESIVHPASGAGGVDGADLPGGAEAGDRTPRNVASGQELPLKNGQRNKASSSASAREWPGVPDEMRIDAEALLKAKKKVDGKLVMPAEMQIAAAALAEFNRQMESDYGLGAHLTGIVMRARERPSWDASKHVRLVQSAWRFRWWERNGNQRRPSPQVIYGARAFENVVQDAADEAAGRKQPENFDLRTKTWPDGRTFDQLTPGEQINARELVARGERPWLPESVRQGPVMAVNGSSNGNGNGHPPMSWTAENFASE